MAGMTYSLDEIQVRALLKALNLTQVGAAAEMGLHKQHLHRLIVGHIEPRFETLSAIARVLKVDDAHSLLVQNG